MEERYGILRCPAQSKGTARIVSQVGRRLEGKSDPPPEPTRFPLAYSLFLLPPLVCVRVGLVCVVLSFCWLELSADDVLPSGGSLCYLLIYDLAGEESSGRQ